ncbi:MAG: YdcF family protein [Pseudomonadota bacterium]
MRLRMLSRLIVKTTFGAVAAVLLAAIAISVDGLRDRIVDADLAIVPGNKIEADGSVSKRLQGRLDSALALYRDGHCKTILVSGGIDGAHFDEALAMKAYLLRHGVREESIFTDNKGVNTFETARFAATLMRERKLHGVILVSQFFHISRFRLALEKNGIAVNGNAHAHYFEARDAYSTLREVFGYVEYLFKPASNGAVVK